MRTVTLTRHEKKRTQYVFEIPDDLDIEDIETEFYTQLGHGLGRLGEVLSESDEIEDVEVED